VMASALDVGATVSAALPRQTQYETNRVDAPIALFSQQLEAFRPAGCFLVAAARRVCEPPKLRPA
jgi:hypothetical protein